MFVLYRLISYILIMTVGLFLVWRFRKNGKKPLYIIVIFLSTVLHLLSMFVPVENYFATFVSPEDVFSYYTGNDNVKISIVGSNSNLVVGKNGNSDSMLIVPKKDKAEWSLDTGLHTQNISQVLSDDAFVELYQHKGTKDLYLVIVALNHHPLDVVDSHGNRFYQCIDNDGTAYAKYVYYAHIANADEDYWLSINGHKITDVILD